MKIKKITGLTAVLLLTVCLLAACGSIIGENYDKSYGNLRNDAPAAPQYAADNAVSEGWDYDYAADGKEYSEEAADVYTETTNDSANTNKGSVTDGRKLIKNANISMETEKLDSILKEIDNKIKAAGGYTEYSDINAGSAYVPYDSSDVYNSTYRQNRYANMTIRVPSNKLDEFMEHVGTLGNVLNRSENVQDVTLAYTDLESRKKVLLTEQERLIEFLSRAETVEDIITLESRLSEVRYELENMESRLRVYDNQIEYSTVTLQITEVTKYTPIEVKEKNLWERMRDGFSKNMSACIEGLKTFVVWLFSHLPNLIVFVIIVSIVAGIIIGIIKKSKKRKAKRVEAIISENEKK